MINKERAKLIEWVDYQINKCSKTIERYQQLGEPYTSLIKEICIEIEYFKDIKKVTAKRERSQGRSWRNDK